MLTISEDISVRFVYVLYLITKIIDKSRSRSFQQLWTINVIHCREFEQYLIVYII